MADCIFCRIASGEIPSRKLFEDEWTMAFMDIAKDVDGHILVIPKGHIGSADEITEKNSDVVRHIFEKIPKIAAAAGLTNGYRIITNVGEDGAQSVHHMHFHILGGVKLSEKLN